MKGGTGKGWRHSSKTTEVTQVKELFCSILLFVLLLYFQPLLLFILTCSWSGTQSQSEGGMRLIFIGPSWAGGPGKTRNRAVFSCS